MKKQNQQKLRGLNDYNMVNVVRKSNHEVGMHSNVLYSLLDPNGLHYQGDLFLSLFIDKVLGIKPDDFGSDIEVRAEEATAENRRIDFTIKSDKYYIGIEMKVNASDQKNQIKDYYKYLVEESERDNKQQVKIYYLTKFGSQPSPYSTGGETIAVELVSFKKHVIDWINYCQHEIRNINNLNLAFEDYKDIVKKITKQHKGNVMTISEELSNSGSKQLLHSALKLDREMLKIKGNTLFSFFEQVKTCLEKEKYTDISGCINNQDNVATNDTCYKWFVNPRSYKGHVGLFFDCGFSDDLYLLVEVATDHLHFGVVTCKTIAGQYDLTNTPSKAELDKWLTHQKWKSFKHWYSKDYGNIRSLNDKTIDLLLDFESSKLKVDILALVTNIKA